VQNNTTEWMRTIPQRRSFKLQFPQSRKTFFLPRFGSVMCWFSWLLTLNAIEVGGLNQKRKVRWMGWCHHCGQLNGHRKNWRRWLRERAQNKIIRQTGKKRGARNKQEKIRNWIVPHYIFRGDRCYGAYGHCTSHSDFAFQTKLTGSMRNGIKNNWNGSENWQDEKWMTMPLMAGDLIWLKHLTTHRHGILICLVN